MEQEGAENSREDPSGDASGDFTFLTRRNVLKLGLAGAGALILGGGGELWLLRGRAPAVKGLRVLNRYEYRTLACIGDTLIPQGGPFEEGAADFDLARRYDVYLSDEPPSNIKTFKRALNLIEYGPVIFERRLVTFSNLDATERLQHWHHWEVSDRLLRRQVALAFRRFLYMMFYDQSAVWPYIGYPGPSLPEKVS